MWTHSDRPFKGVDKIAAATEFIFAAERLIARDVRPEVLPENERACVEYYLELLSQKFSGSQTRANISRVLQSAMHIDEHGERTRFQPFDPTYQGAFVSPLPEWFGTQGQQINWRGPNTTSWSVLSFSHRSFGVILNRRPLPSAGYTGEFPVSQFVQSASRQGFFLPQLVQSLLRDIIAFRYLQKSD